MGRHSGQNCWGSFVGVALNAALSGLSQGTVNVAMGVFINTGHSPHHTSVHFAFASCEYISSISLFWSSLVFGLELREVFSQILYPLVR